MTPGLEEQFGAIDIYVFDQLARGIIVASSLELRRMP